MPLLSADSTVALMVDFQEKIVPAMCDANDLIVRSQRLISGLDILSIPIIFTRQYPKGLGDTIEVLQKHASNVETYDKTSFSCLGTPIIRDRLVDVHFQNVILAGIETHICILQTAIELMDVGKKVYLVVDAVSSRTSLDSKISIQRLIQLGAIPTTSEAVLFELMRDAHMPEFKKISAIVK